jgi:1-acyl-sn-glycerol-3-phosphate acyltransferase
MYQLFVLIYRVLFGWLFKLQVIGYENVPNKNGVLLCFSHWDFLDAFIMMFAVRRSMKAFVASNYIWTPVVLPFWLIGHAISIRRGKRDVKAIRKALQVLCNGEVFAISPQGTRARMEKLGAAKYGPGFLAAWTGVPVVPVAIIGSRGGLSSVLKFKRPSVKIVFGRPRYLEIDRHSLEDGLLSPAVKAYCSRIGEEQIMPSLKALHQKYE